MQYITHTHARAHTHALPCGITLWTNICKAQLLFRIQIYHNRQKNKRRCAWVREIERSKARDHKKHTHTHTVYIIFIMQKMQRVDCFIRTFTLLAPWWKVTNYFCKSMNSRSVMANMEIRPSVVPNPEWDPPKGWPDIFEGSQDSKDEEQSHILAAGNCLPFSDFLLIHSSSRLCRP